MQVLMMPQIGHFISFRINGADIVQEPRPVRHDDAITSGLINLRCCNGVVRVRLAVFDATEMSSAQGDASSARNNSHAKSRSIG